MAENKGLTNRERDLVNRGYDIDVIRHLCNYTEEEVKDAVDAIFARITLNCNRVSNPTCTYIGGQPGVGKSSTLMRTKLNYLEDGVVEIGIDNYRMYHPRYLEMEEEIKKHWANREQSENDTPGNDIADFTHSFAGEVTDLLVDRVSTLEDGKAFNILFEWGMRTPEGPLKTMKELRDKGYNNIVDFVVVYKNISLEACKLRADIMNTGNHIVRRVPPSFHNLCVNTLPDSCNDIYKKGFLEDKLIGKLLITTRDGNIVWNSDNNKTLPGEVLREYLNNPNLSINYNNDVSLAKSCLSEESIGITDKKIEELKKMKEEILSITMIDPEVVTKNIMKK